MPPVARCAVNLSFYGDALEPDEITELLGIQPSEAHRKGESPPERRTGMWSVRSLEADVVRGIREILASTAAQPTVWRELTARFHARVFVGIFMEESNEGVRIPPDVLALLSERGLALDLDIYASDQAT